MRRVKKHHRKRYDRDMAIIIRLRRREIEQREIREDERETLSKWLARQEKRRIRRLVEEIESETVEIMRQEVPPPIPGLEEGSWWERLSKRLRKFFLDDNGLVKDP